MCATLSMAIVVEQFYIGQAVENIANKKLINIIDTKNSVIWINLNYSNKIE